MQLERLRQQNAEAEARRPWTADGYRFRPIGWHDEHLHRLKSTYPYFGFVDVGVQGLGRFVMFSNDDDLVAQTYFWFGPDAYESYSVRIWRYLAERASCIVDVGAFTGLFTLIAKLANAEAEVHAVEPIPRCIERLMMNLRANRLGQRVRVHEAAAGRRTERGQIRRYQGDLRISSAASLMERSLPERRTLPVDIVALDDLETSQQPDLLKIDVEFAEALVLEGLRDSIRGHAPTLLLEITGLESLRACRQLLPGYRLAVIDDVHQVARPQGAALLADGATRNVLCHHGSARELAEIVDAVPPL